MSINYDAAKKSALVTKYMVENRETSTVLIVEFNDNTRYFVEVDIGLTRDDLATRIGGLAMILMADNKILSNKETSPTPLIPKKDIN